MNNVNKNIGAAANIKAGQENNNVTQPKPTH